MPKEKHDYFAAFAKQIEYSVREAALLVDTIKNFTTAEAVESVLPEVHRIESEADEVAHSNYNAIAFDFITPLDRDDIIDLTYALDNVVDKTEAVIQSFYITNVHFMHEDALPMAELIKKGCEELQNAMQPFADMKRSQDFHDALMRVNDCEEEADDIYMKAIRKLHTQDVEDPVRLLVWTRIFSSLEATCDAFEHVGDLMGSIYIKNV